MVLLELAVLANAKKLKNNRFVRPLLFTLQQIDPDRTLKKLRRK